MTGCSLCVLAFAAVCVTQGYFDKAIFQVGPLHLLTVRMMITVSASAASHGVGACGRGKFIAASSQMCNLTGRMDSRTCVLCLVYGSTGRVVTSVCMLKSVILFHKYMLRKG